MKPYDYASGVILLGFQKEFLSRTLDHLFKSKAQTYLTEQYQEAQITSYIFQISTIETLAKGTEIIPNSKKLLFDFASIYTLIRTTIESYFALHYLYFELNNETQRDEAVFRYLLYNIHGLNIRHELQKVMTPLPEKKLALEKEKEILNDYIKDIQKNSYFLQLHPKKQKQILKDMPARDVSTTQLLSKPYFKINDFKQTWEHLCNYAHSDFISALQLKHIFSNPSLLNGASHLIVQPMYAIIMLNASMFNNLSKRYIEAKQFYDSLPENFRKMNDFYYYSSQFEEPHPTPEEKLT